MDWAHLAGAGGWNKLFDRYYRKQEIYEMSWNDVDLSKMIVAGSPFAGPFGEHCYAQFAAMTVVCSHAPR